MFLELKNENEFKRNYFDTLKYRLAYGSLELEGLSGDLAEITQSMKIFNQLNAINFIFGDKDHEKELSHYEFTNLVCDVVNHVSGGEISDFRKTKAIVQGSKVERSKASMIRNDLWFLIDDYNYMIKNAKSMKEICEIEAIFHIRFLHIHPFEDANGRTARILLAYNMAKNNLAPCIITKEIKREYCDYIERNDIKGLARLFEKLSQMEIKNMLVLYKDLNEKGLIETNNMTKEQEEAYKSLKKHK